MDATRFCYKAPCRFTAGGPLVDIHWYWADDGASRYLLPHAFPAMTGYRQFKFNDTNVGEMWEAWPRHASVFGPTGVLGSDVDGTPAQFLGQGVFGPIAMADLPACLLPILYEVEIDIGGDSRVALFEDQTLLLSIEESPERATIEVSAGNPFMDVMEQCILLGADNFFEFEIIALSASTTSAVESACVKISAESTNDDPPTMLAKVETAVIDLSEQTTPILPIKGAGDAVVLLSGNMSSDDGDATIDIETSDTDDPTAVDDVEIDIGLGDDHLSDGDVGGGGGGVDCDHAVEMTHGTEYTADVASGTEQWWWMSEPAFTFVHVKRLSSSGGSGEIDVYTGSDCGSKTSIATLSTDGACTQTSSMGVQKVFVRVKHNSGATFHCVFVGDDGSCP